MPELGDTLRFSSDLYAEPGGSLTDALTVVLTITLPDGTTATPTVTNPPDTTGLYLYDYTTTTSSPLGRYVGKWLFTFAGGATTSYEETFDVGASLVTLDEALEHLRKTSDTTVSEADLDYLQWLCFVATDAVERDLDRVMVPRSVTETYDGGGSVVLDRTPVISVSTVVESGTTLTDFVVKPASGVLYRGTSSSPSRFLSGFQNISVTYLAGYYNPPLVARKVALNAVQGMWQTSQQAPHQFLDQVPVEVFTASVASLTPVEMAGYNSLRSAAMA